MPLMVEKWSCLFNIPFQFQNKVSWELFFKSLATQTLQIQPFMTKYNARILPVGTNLKRRRHSDLASSCPCCGEIEDHYHLITCKQVMMATTYDKCSREIMALLKEQTNDIIHNGIEWLLQTYRNPSSANPLNIPWVQEQMLLGHCAFFAGLWLKQWVTTQEKHYLTTRSTRSAALWIKKLIHAIQLIPYTMWQT